jgi:acyl-CoA thioester hydrolase
MSEFSETLTRVRYKDTDQMGMVYYGNYFTFFEIGRVEYMRERGIAYNQMEREDDSYIVVTEANCRYLRPARYDDLLRIRTRVRESRRRSIRFAYEILRHEDGELLATGETVHIICNGEGRPRSLPEKYRQMFPLGAEAEHAGVASTQRTQRHRAHREDARSPEPES